MEVNARPDCQSCKGSGEGNEVVDSVGNKGPCLACHFAPPDDKVLLARAVHEHVRTHAFHGSVGPSVGIGMFTSDGRQVGATVSRVGELFRLTDGGETWSDLWMDGFTDDLGEEGIRRAERIAKDYGVEFVDRVIVGFAAREEDIALVTMKVAACSIAIDALRFS